MNLVKLSKYFGLYNLYVSMFQCFTETNGWPGISAGFLCNIWYSCINANSLIHIASI